MSYALKGHAIERNRIDNIDIGIFYKVISST